MATPTRPRKKAAHSKQIKSGHPSDVEFSSSEQASEQGDNDYRPTRRSTNKSRSPRKSPSKKQKPSPADATLKKKKQALLKSLTLPSPEWDLKPHTNSYIPPPKNYRKLFEGPKRTPKWREKLEKKCSPQPDFMEDYNFEENELWFEEITGYLDELEQTDKHYCELVGIPHFAPNSEMLGEIAGMEDAEEVDAMFSRWINEHHEAWLRSLIASLREDQTSRISKLSLELVHRIAKLAAPGCNDQGEHIHVWKYLEGYLENEVQDIEPTLGSVVWDLMDARRKVWRAITSLMGPNGTA